MIDIYTHIAEETGLLRSTVKYALTEVLAGKPLIMVATDNNLKALEVASIINSFDDLREKAPKSNGGGCEMYGP